MNTDRSSHLHLVPALPAEAPAEDVTDRDTFIRVVRARSGRAWSVKGGRGTSWGWVTITSTPARQNEHGNMTAEDQADLSALLGQRVSHQGVDVPAGEDYRREYAARAAGRAPEVLGTAYWD